MNKAVKIKDVVIGEGLPKICVPIVGETLEQLVEEAENLNNMDIDVIEWRADFYDSAEDIDKVRQTLKTIKKILVSKPVIFTFRSDKEGGQKEISKEYYIELNKSITQTKLADIIDVELFNNAKDIKVLVETAHANGVAVIISNHDFQGTPAKQEIISRLCTAFDLGGDIAKIAVMPASAEDVITLLDATRIMKEQYANGPIITMSMAGKGVISRLSGELFGSALTFGAAKKTSAPGQIPAEDLRRIIQLLHNNLTT